MGDIGSFAAIEVLIGLSFVFFLLSTACSGLQEMLSSVLGWRAKTLEDAVGTMLGNPKVKRGVKEWFGHVDKLGVADTDVVKAHAEAGVPVDLASAVFEHWRIKGLVRDPDSSLRRRSRPSYLPPRALPLAIAETLALHAPPPPKPGARKGAAASGGTEDSPWQRTDDQILAAVQAAVKRFPGSHQREMLQKAAVNAHGDLEGFRTQVETAFDDSMDRASGWYKRKAQLVLALLATIFAIGFNVDTVRIATHLYNDEAVRTAVVSKVNSADAQQAADAVSQVNQLQLPIGWGAENRPSEVTGWLGAIAGWLITIAALNLGAPFWFDLLSRISRQRGVGTPEKPGRVLSDKPKDDAQAEPPADVAPPAPPAPPVPPARPAKAS